jgi:hypothetical protein
MKLRIMLLALAMVAWVAMTGSALWAQTPGPSYSPEGAWLAQATITGFPTATPYMDTYTSDSTNQGRSGTVLCTLPFGKSLSPLGIITLTASGHGNWVRIDKNKFAFTAWRFLLNADTGQVVGTAKFWGTVTVETKDTFTGTMNAQYYRSDGTPLVGFKGTTAGNRIEVQIEEP